MSFSGSEFPILGAGNPGGPNQSIQFNNGGVFDGFGSWDGSSFVISGLLSLDGIAKLYELGDFNVLNNGSRLKVDDANSILSFVNSVGQYFGINPPLINTSSLYFIGDDPGGDGIFIITGGTASKQAYIQLGGGGIVLDLNRTLSTYRLGDVSNGGNSTLLNVDDAAQLIRLNTLNGILINSTGLINDDGVAFTVTPSNGNVKIQGAPGQTEHFFDLILDGGGQSSFFGKTGGLKITGQIGPPYAAVAGPEIELNGSGQGVLRSFDRAGGVLQDWLIEGSIIYLRPNNTLAVIIGDVNNLTVNNDSTLIHTNLALSNHAGVFTGTLTNAPSVGNPTKWIKITDNGVSRYIPTWT